VSDEEIFEEGRGFSNLASVNADVIELWYFDCRHDRGLRTVEREDDAPPALERRSSALPERATFVDKQVIETICGTRCSERTCRSAGILRAAQHAIRWN
jgi:hypothetical protein